MDLISHFMKLLTVSIVNRVAAAGPQSEKEVGMYQGVTKQKMFWNKRSLIKKENYTHPIKHIYQNIYISIEWESNYGCVLKQ